MHRIGHSAPLTSPNILLCVLLLSTAGLFACATAGHEGARAPSAHGAAAQARGPSGGTAKPAAAAAAAKAQKGSPGRRAHFAIISDFGESGLGERQVADLVHSWQPDFIVTLGDNNYPNGAEATIDANIGQYYGDYIALKKGRTSAYPTSSTQKFFPALGNHDWRARGAVPYLNYFDLPGNGRYYTFERGPVAFFIIDSDPHEPDGTDVDSKQAAWLRQQLAASQAPHKVVVMHHPPYSSGHHGSSPWMQWPFGAWGATVVLAGHDHTYEHVVVDGLHYLVMGLSGAERDTFKVACALPQASHDFCYDGNFGALEAEADDATLTLRLITIDGRVQDTLQVGSGAAQPRPLR